MNNLYKFGWYCGRSEDVEGLFIATEDELNEAIGSNVYFGEILGKHSEVHGILENCDVTKLEVSEATVEDLLKVCGSSVSGYNPLKYLEESEEDEED